MSSNVPAMEYKSDRSNVADEKDLKNTYEEEHVEAAAAGTRDDAILSKDFGQYIHDAAEAVDGQKSQTVIQALKRWRKGVLYSVIFST